MAVRQRSIHPSKTTGPSARTSRALAVAFGIVVVLGKGTRGQEPRPIETAAAPDAPGAPVSDTPVSDTPVAPEPITTPEPPPITPDTPVDVVKQTTPTPEKKKEKSPWRGSEIAYRNSVTAISADRSYDLTYNPFWGMAFEVSPRFWFDDVWSVSASLEIQREITEADDTTLDDETLLGDLSLRLGASNFAKIPGVDIKVSAGLGFTFPTSLASQGDTLMFSVSPSLRLSRSFDVLEGLDLGYSLRFTKNFHEYTTSELDSPIIPGCFVGDSGSCDRFLNTGYRNSSYRISNGFDVSLGLTSWLTFSADFSVIVSWLYADVDDERVSHVELEPVNERYALSADVGFSAKWWEPLEVRVGASTFNPQLQSDGDYYAPFFNRFTNLYLDLRLDVAALVQDLTEEN